MRLFSPRLIWDLYALAYDAVSDFTPYQQLLAQVVEKLDLQPGQKLLDLGCGTGNLEAELIKRDAPNLEIIAVDISPKMLEKAKRRITNQPQITFTQLDLNQPLPFKPETFDRVVGLHVLYALPNPHQILAQIARVLKKEGRAILVEPRPDAKMSALFKENFKNRNLTRTLGRSIISLPSLVWIMLINRFGLLKLIKQNQKWLTLEKWQTGFKANSLELLETQSTYAGQSSLFVVVKK